MLASRIMPPGRRAHQAEQRDGEHGDGDRGRDGEPDPQAEVGVGGAEEDAEDDAGDGGAQGELDDRLSSRESGGFMRSSLSKEGLPHQPPVQLHVLLAPARPRSSPSPSR